MSTTRNPTTLLAALVIVGCPIVSRADFLFAAGVSHMLPQYSFIDDAVLLFATMQVTGHTAQISFHAITLCPATTKLANGTC